MKNFCVVPWYERDIDLVNGKESVCCWISQDISRLDLQHQFLSDSRPRACKRCWASEDRGIESRRQMENRFLDFKMDRDIELINHDVQQGNVEPNLYQLRLVSTCNGSCVTCGPGASSAWRALLGNHVSIRHDSVMADRYFEKYSTIINWHAAKRFNFLGGEPLLIRQSFDILDKLLDAGNTDCRISFVTNGSVQLSVSQIKTLRNFSDISCCVSIDGIGRSFEYIRYPLSWSNLLINLESYREIFNEVVVSFTISNLNYHQRPEILQWFRDQKLLYIENYVESPVWFNYQVGPLHDLWPRFVQEISHQDRIKGINIADYLPCVAESIRLTCH